MLCFTVLTEAVGGPYIPSVARAQEKPERCPRNGPPSTVEAASNDTVEERRRSTRSYSPPREPRPGGPERRVGGTTRREKQHQPSHRSRTKP